MKKFITTLLSLALVIGMCPAMASAETTLSGAGTPESPYLIATATDLIAARDMINSDTTGTGYADGSYKVTEDIDLSGYAWTPIAPLVAFTGSFDGNNCKISNVSMTIDNDYIVANTGLDSSTNTYKIQPQIGFFGKLSGAKITSLGLDTVSVSVKAPYTSTIASQGKVQSIGVFAGYVADSASVSDCFVKNASLTYNGNSLNVAYGIGGFAGGAANSAVVSDCYIYNAGIDSNYKQAVSGFIGNIHNSSVTVTNCYAAGITTTETLRALAPLYGFCYTNLSAKITNCYSESDDILPGSDAPVAYASTYSKGTVGMTKEGLVEAMTAVGYSADETANDGYPCFERELPEADVWDGTAATSFAEGSGTEEDPYKIYTAAELKLAADTVNSTTAKYYFELQNDIDYENNAWAPIGYSDANGGTHYFQGGFDGNGHVVRNLEIGHTTAYYYCGFFGLVKNAVITDLGIENFKLVHDNNATTYDSSGNTYKFSYIGGFAAQVRDSIRIENCYIKDSEIKQTSAWSNGEASLAGFVGTADLRGADIEIKNCYVDGLSLQGQAQGPVSAFTCGVTYPTANTATSVKFTNCYAANVTNAYAGSTFYAFGFAGGSAYAQNAYDTSKIIVTDCYSTATTTEGTHAASSTDVTWTLASGVYTPENASLNKWQLVSGTYFGTEAQTTSAISTAFASLAGWQDGTEINAGLPALAWETAPVAEAVAPYVVKAFSAAKGTVTLTVNETASGDVVYVAAYDADGRLVSCDVKNVAAYDADGRLVSCDVKNVAADITDVEVSTTGASTLKVFIWNNVEPVISAVSKTLVK